MFWKVDLYSLDANDVPDRDLEKIQEKVFETPKTHFEAQPPAIKFKCKAYYFFLIMEKDWKSVCLMKNKS